MIAALGAILFLNERLTLHFVVAAAFVIGGIAFSSLGREFIPTLDEGDIAMQALRVPSASLEQSLAMQMALERVIKAQPGV